MTVTLHLGDCLEYMRTMETGSVDAVITDLPYGTTACSWDSVIPFAPMWEAIKHVLRPRGAFVTTSSQPFTSALVMSNVEWFRYELTWTKTVATNFLNVYRQPLRNHENILVFCDGQTTYNPQMRKGTPYIDCRKETERRFSATNHSTQKTPIFNKGERFPLSVIEFANGNQDSDHPTQKPVALYSYLIRTYTNAGDTVLDMTMGSGTTGVACVKTGRNFIGCELDPTYFAIAEKRITEAQMQLPLLEDRQA